MVGAVERQRPRMDDLSRLVNRLFCRQQDGDFLLQPHCLRELRRTDQRVHHVPQLVITRKACRELELRLGRPSTVQRPCEKDARFMIRGCQLDAHGSRSRNHFIF